MKLGVVEISIKVKYFLTIFNEKKSTFNKKLALSSYVAGVFRA